MAICDIRFTSAFERLMTHNNKSTLAEDLEIMSGNTPTGFFKRESYEIEQILKATGRENRFESVKTFSIIGFAVGCLLAFLMGNGFLVPVLGIAFAYIPIIYIRATAGSYKKQLNAELETALSIITTSYLRTEDILISVKENIHFINAPVKVHFEEFITESELINANTVSALNRLKLKIPNYIFHEWVNTLIRCQSDRTMKNTLLAVIQKFSDMRAIQSELDTTVASVKREAFMMMGLVIVNIPLLYAINRDWFMTLVYSLQGKITLAVCAAIVLFSFVRIMKLSAPIEYKGG
jgi:hypothetical protein